MSTARKRAPSLRDTVRAAIRDYLDDMGPTEASNLHQRLLSEVEPPLIEEVLRHTGGNQSRSARILGVTRNTLRARMKHYGISPQPGRIRRSA